MQNAQRAQPLLALLLGAELGQQFHVAGVGGGTVQRLGGDRRAVPGDLGQRGVLEVGQPGALGVAGQEEVPQPPAASLGLELGDHGRPLPGEPGPRRLRGLLGEDRFGREDVLGHEGEQPLAPFLRAVVVREVHGALPAVRSELYLLASIHGGRRARPGARGRGASCSCGTPLPV